MIVYGIVALIDKTAKVDFSIKCYLAPSSPTLDIFLTAGSVLLSLIVVNVGAYVSLTLGMLGTCHHHFLTLKNIPPTVSKMTQKHTSAKSVTFTNS